VIRVLLVAIAAMEIAEVTNHVGDFLQKYQHQLRIVAKFSST
jgi:hypothetical protein